MTGHLDKEQLNSMKKEGYTPDVIVLEWTPIVLLADMIKEIFPQAKLVASEHDVTFLGYYRKYKYENGIITNIPSDKIENMSSIYGCSPSYIMGWDQPIPKSFTCTPEEESMIKKFRRLTPTGKQSVLAILDIQL